MPGCQHPETVRLNDWVTVCCVCGARKLVGDKWWRAPLTRDK